MPGMMMSSTSEDTILPNAAPMITPTAMSMTLPFMAKSLNSWKNLRIVVVFYEVVFKVCGQESLLASVLLCLSFGVVVPDCLVLDAGNRD